jgi:glucose-1-phosphate adenylyltransferase
MTDAVIEQDATLDHAILDKRIRVGAGARIGAGDAMTGKAACPSELLTVVGKNTRIPAGSRIGRNCIISADLDEDAFAARHVPDGAVVGPADP